VIGGQPASWAAESYFFFLPRVDPGRLVHQPTNPTPSSRGGRRTSPAGGPSLFGFLMAAIQLAMVADRIWIWRTPGPDLLAGPARRPQMELVATSQQQLRRVLAPSSRPGPGGASSASPLRLPSLLVVNRTKWHLPSVLRGPVPDRPVLVRRRQRPFNGRFSVQGQRQQPRPRKHARALPIGAIGSIVAVPPCPCAAFQPPA